MSKALEKIEKYIEENPNPENQFQFMKTVWQMATENGKVVEDCREKVGLALGYMGQCYLYGWDDVKENGAMAWVNLIGAYNNGNRFILEDLGLCYYKGYGSPDGKPDVPMAMQFWKEGMDEGDNQCALRYCTEKVDNDEADEETISKLEEIASLPEDPVADAAALLYLYYSNEGDEDKAWEWREKAIDMESELMDSLLEDEKEEEVGEDDWTKPDTRGTDMSIFFGDSEDDDDDDDDEFDGYDDETEAAGAAWNPEIGDKYVIVALTNDSFRILQADASDWRSLPALIGAERCDDMRCQKFRDVSARLHLPGTLLGQLDKDAFRKPKLKLNYHASQWYDGMADLAGNMIICMEDSKYNPFSFTSKEEAQKVIDSLCGK